MEGICTRAQSASSSSESLSNAGHILRPKASSSGSSNGNGTPRAGSTTRNPVLHAPSLRATHHGSSSASHHSSTHHSNGCVRWCINVALQSFGGEPWAVALRPAEEAESELSFLTGSANEAARLPQVRPQTTSNSASSSLSSFGDPTAETIFHNNAVSRHAPHSTAATRCGLQLSLQEDLDGFVDGPAHEAAAHSEELQALVSCLHDINDPPMRYGTDELLLRFTHVEFEPEYPPAGVPPTEGIRYRLNSCVDGMLNATLQPAVSAVVDHCVNAMVLVYGATQEMKQMGLIGTPTECGLLPHGIRLMLDKLTEREERQRTSQTSGGGGTAPNSPRSRAAHHDAHGTEAPPTANGTTAEPTMPGSARGSESFILPHIGTTKHRFVRVEATFIAFDSTSVVDLLDLSNQHVELVLQLAPPPSPTTMSGEDRQSDDGSSSGNTAPSGANKTTDAFVVNARAMNADTVNSALSALDVGLENLSRAMEQSLLQSESSSSLLFSLTAYTDTCRCATMHLFCLAEDPAAQIWLASTVQARSQAIPLGEEQSWASIQNTPMPPPLHHHAATMLVPALCFGNVFTSVLLCVYNSTAAIGRLNRDLKIAVSGYRMRTIPLVTHASTRRSTEKLPAGWEEHFTQDGRRYFIDSSTYTTTWSDPRIHPVHYTKPKCFCGHTCGCGTECVCRGGSKCPAGVASQQRPYRIPMQPDDKDFLGNTLRECCHASAPNPQPGAVVNGSAEQAPPPLVDVGIVVVDPTCKPRIVLHAQHKDFAWQVRVEQEHWKEEEAKLLDSKQAVEETAAAAAVDAGAHHDGLEGGGSSIAQARHCSGDEDMDQAQEANPAMDEDALISLIKTGKFFSAAMAEQVAASGTEPCGTSASSSSATPQCGPPSLSASAVDGGTTVAISPDMQDMESLVDEFTLFFRKAYRTEQRVKELEAEVAMLRSHAPRPDRVGECGGGDGDVVEPTPPWAASLASELTSVRSAKLQTQLRSALERASRSSTKLGAQPADTSICQSLWQEVIRELDDPSA